MFMRKTALAVIAAVLASPAVAQTSFTFKDASGTTRTAKSFDCSSQICSLVVPADSTGAALGVTGNPFIVQFPSAQAVTGPLTDTQLRATAVPVSGPLTDTQLRATAVPVSGPLTDTQLRATPVPVSGTVTASGPLTDTQLRATAVPVSGTVTATGPLTDTQLRATAVPVSGPLTDTQLRATAVPISGLVTANPGTAANWGIGAFAAAQPLNGSAIGLFDGTNLIRAKGDETSGLWVNIKAGAGSGGTALADEAAFTQGTTSVTPFGCLYATSITNLTAGQAGVVRCTSDRQEMVSDAALLASLGAIGDSAWVSGNGSTIAVLKAIANGVTGSIPAGTNTIGGVINGASAYETVAASQTAQALGATGATGDYLSHCVVTPGTTSPGVVTILDNATTIVAFPGGASSVSNLVPFSIPMGAVSASGAWKVTTGANVTVVCVGRFT